MTRGFTGLEEDGRDRGFQQGRAVESWQYPKWEDYYRKQTERGWPICFDDEGVQQAAGSHGP
jgi:hypothetical protein